MQLGKQILRGFQNALEYLREMEFTICERIPYTLPTQHSADSENCGVFVCMMMLIFLKKRFTNKLNTNKCRAMLAFWILTGELYEYQSVL